jgi:hypothetical protein
VHRADAVDERVECAGPQLTDVVCADAPEEGRAAGADRQDAGENPGAPRLLPQARLVLALHVPERPQGRVGREADRRSRVDDGAEGGASAVGRHHELELAKRTRPSKRLDRVGSRIDADDPRPGHDAHTRLGRRGHERVEQDATFDAEGKRVLGVPVIAEGDEAARGAFAGMERADWPGPRGDTVEQAEAGKRGLAGRLEEKPGADGSRLGRLLEDGDLVPPTRERDGDRTAADPQPRYRDPHPAPSCVRYRANTGYHDSGATPPPGAPDRLTCD